MLLIMKFYLHKISSNSVIVYYYYGNNNIWTLAYFHHYHSQECHNLRFPSEIFFPKIEISKYQHRCFPLHSRDSILGKVVKTRLNAVA